MKQPMLRRAASYDDLWKQIDYRTMEFPHPFNLGTACLDDHDPATRAMTVVHADRTATTYTFGAVRRQADRPANALAGLGIGPGDGGAVGNPAPFGTAVPSAALWGGGA